MSDADALDDEEVRVGTDADVEATTPEQGDQQPQAISREQAREELTRLIELCAQSGLPADDVAEILRERADATEYLYEGMARYARRQE
jgi:DNA-binding transcriptional regulator YhcF (GntR family)